MGPEQGPRCALAEGGPPPALGVKFKCCRPTETSRRATGLQKRLGNDAPPLPCNKKSRWAGTEPSARQSSWRSRQRAPTAHFFRQGFLLFLMRAEKLLRKGLPRVPAQLGAAGHGTVLTG